jgi:glycosyltransferase involved in cell wall biosynthesis
MAAAAALSADALRRAVPADFAWAAEAEAPRGHATSARLRVAVLFHRIGPYHLARLEAAGARCELTAIELSAVDRTYAWAPVRGARSFTRTTLSAGQDVDLAPRALIRRGVRDLLAAAAPDVVAIPGWSHPGALAALLWCVRNGRPALLMSASAEQDDARRPAREAIKRRVVRLFGSALVGGAPQRDYACALGLPAPAVVPGYDVVDNGHFDRGAREARASGEPLRARLGLPARFFLASARFVAKKNLGGLLDAYAGYRRRAGADAWRLVLLGDGPLRAEVERRIARPDLAGQVVLPGFRQYHELPAYYGLAGAFVHASTTEQWGLVVNEAMAAGLPVLISERCGCAPDLVRDGVNGFTFDPPDVDELTGLMQRIAALTDEQRRAMGEAGRSIVADWGPERFAGGLMQAVEAAMRRPAPQASWLDRALLGALARRPL